MPRKPSFVKEGCATLKIASMAQNRAYLSVALPSMLGNMRIHDATLDEFIQIYREEFGEEINRSEASEMAFFRLSAGIFQSLFFLIDSLGGRFSSRNYIATCAQ